MSEFSDYPYYKPQIPVESPKAPKVDGRVKSPHGQTECKFANSYEAQCTCEHYKKAKYRLGCNHCRFDIFCDK